MNNCIWIILLLLLGNCNNGGERSNCGCGNARDDRRDGCGCGNARDDRRDGRGRGNAQDDRRDGCGCGNTRDDRRDGCGNAQNDGYSINNRQSYADDRAVGPMPIFGPESSCGCNASEMPVNEQM